MGFLKWIFGLGELAKPSPDWTKGKRIAGREQRLSHVSGLAVDDKFAYVTSGGNLADQHEGLSGLRKIDLETGAVTILDDGQRLPQSDYGGIVLDEKFVYWNAEGNILRVSKDGGIPEPIASEHVGIGLDIAIDDEKVYWANHGYYSPYTSIKPRPVYMVSKQGGTPQIVIDQQNVPGGLIADENFVYWQTVNGIFKQTKSGGQCQTVFQATDQENVDHLTQDAESLYFGFRSAGSPYWALRKVSKTGGEPQTLVKEYSLKPFVVDEANVYFFAEERRGKDSLCKISKNGGEITKFDNGYASGVITQSKAHIYLASLDDIYSFEK